MTSPLNSIGINNPPNLPSNPANIYLSYTEAVQSALAVSRTNPSVTYYLIYTEYEPGGAYKITTSPDESSAHAFVAGEMIPL